MGAEQVEAPTPLVLLTLLVDEMRETISLLRVVDAATVKRPWWRTFFFGFMRTGQDVVGGMAIQYLGENIDRARTHWCDAIDLAAQVAARGAESDPLRQLSVDLEAAGFGAILPKLAHASVPGPIKQAAPYLHAVTDEIRACARLVQETKQRLTLQRMREAPDRTV